MREKNKNACSWFAGNLPGMSFLANECLERKKDEVPLVIVAAFGFLSEWVVSSLSL